MPKFLVNIDLNQNEIQNVSLQKLTTAPSNPTKGQVYYNTVDNRSYYWNGNSWVGMDSFGATMSAENIVTAINGSTFLIDDDNLSANVNDAISKAHNTHAISDVSGLQTVLDSKVDKIAGKGLSTNDYTTTEKTKLSGITTGATKVEDSTTNGNIKINGVENVVYTHPTGTNPHGTTKSDIGLGNIDNTSDLDKPISTATQTALNGKVDNSRVLTDVPAGAKFTDTVTTINGKTGIIAKADIVALGIPAQDTVYTLPIATSTVLGGVKSGTDITVDASGNVSVNDNSHNHVISNVDGLQNALDSKETPAGATSKASTAENNAKSYTDTKLAELVGSAPATLDTLNELAQALGDNPNFATTITNELAKKTDKHSQSIGDGSATSIVVTHNLNTRDVVITLRETASPYAQVITDVEFTSVNTITLKFAVAPTSNQYTVTIVG